MIDAKRARCFQTAWQTSGASSVIQAKCFSVWAIVCSGSPKAVAPPQQHGQRAAGRTASSALGARLLRQGLACGGIVSGAGLYFVILFGFNFQFTVSAVELGVSRGVANVVLAAQFCGDLIKSLFQFVELIADVDHPAASCFGEFMHFAFAGVGHANAKII